ncbi:MAG: endonuclease NucS [Candidatus Bathyarchaeia archaeon]
MGKSKRQMVLENPSLKEAFEAVRLGVSRRRTVVVVGNCRVDYEGRASSKLERGERIVLFKSDGSALVHRPRDYAPVNWQPPGSLFRTRVDDDNLTVRVFRRRENEVLEVSFDRVFLVAVLDLTDVGEFHLYASEEDMKRAILMEPSLLEEGFRPITAERPVEPGFIDILGVDGDNVLTVVEIKRKAATKEAAIQLKRYLDVFKVDSDREVRGLLVAPELARGAQKMLATLGLEFKALSPQRCAEVLRSRKGRRLTEFLGQ